MRTALPAELRYKCERCDAAPGRPCVGRVKAGSFHVPRTDVATHMQRGPCKDEPVLLPGRKLYVYADEQGDGITTMRKPWGIAPFDVVSTNHLLWNSRVGGWYNVYAGAGR